MQTDSLKLGMALVVGVGVGLGLGHAISVYKNRTKGDSPSAHIEEKKSLGNLEGKSTEQVEYAFLTENVSVHCDSDQDSDVPDPVIPFCEEEEPEDEEVNEQTEIEDANEEHEVNEEDEKEHETEEDEEQQDQDQDQKSERGDELQQILQESHQQCIDNQYSSDDQKRAHILEWIKKHRLEVTSKSCHVCMENYFQPVNQDVSVSSIRCPVQWPCCKQSTCAECMATILSLNQPKCPLCRKPYNEKYQVYTDSISR